MFDKPQATHALGLDIDGNTLKIVALNTLRNKPKVESFYSFPFEQSSLEKDNVKLLYNDVQLKTLCQKCLVVTSISASNILVRPLDLKIKKKKDIDAVLSFQAEPILPYPVENAVLDRIILSQEKEGSHIILTAARKDHLTNHISFWKSLDIEPEVISAAPFAISLFAKNFTNSEETYYVLYLGVTQIFCVLIDKGQLAASQAVQGDLIKLLEALSTEKKMDLKTVRSQLDDYSLQLPRAIESNELKTAIEELRLSVTRTIFSLAKQTKGRDVNAILITGPGATIEGLPEELCQQLNKILLPLKQEESFGMTPSEMHAFALPTGAALSALPLGYDQINFRQQEFAYPTPWKRLKKTMFAYLLLCLGLGIALTIYSKTYTSYREAEIKKQYLELLNVMNRPYGEFEKEYSNKRGSNQTSIEVQGISSLSSEEIKSRLDYLEKEIQATPQTYPLLPNVPLVSDVLAWISTHPIFVGVKTNGQAESLQIESFNYVMIKRPEPTKKQEKYQIKVELEFSSPTPKMAREFHDALIAPNEIVDPKGEIKWSSNRDRYRTSFYLKDKTVYPSL